MKTAKEYLIQEIGLMPFCLMGPREGEAICNAIKTAMKESIEECAEIVRKENKDLFHKQSILNLIKEIK